MLNFLRNFYRSFYIYAIGIISSNFLILLILPYLTEVFNPDQFAIIEIYTILITLIMIITNFGLGDAQSFYYYKYKENSFKQKQVISKSFILRILITIITLIILSLIYITIDSFKNIFNYNFILFATIFLIASLTGIFNQGLIVLNIKFYQWKFNIFNILKTFLIFVFLIFFLYLNNLSINGYFYSYFFSYLLVTIILWFYLRQNLSLSPIDSNLFKKIIFYGFPLIFTQLSWYFMSVLDRIFINYYLDKTSLGIYAIAGKFALIINLIIEIFNRTWLPFLMKEVNELRNTTNESKAIFEFIAKIYTFITCIIIIILSLLSEFIITNLSNYLYHEAKYIFPLLCWYLIFYGFFNIISSSMWIEKKTYYTTIVMFLTLILNLLLNFYFVPIYGVYGAAFSTIGSYSILLVVTIIIVRNIKNIIFPYIFISLNYLLVFIISITILYSQIDILIKILLSFLYIIISTIYFIKNNYKLFIMRFKNS